MRIQRKLLVAAALAGIPALALAAPPAPSAPNADRPSILLLGTVHLSGQTTDLMSPTVPDVFGEKHQRELVDLVATLARYRPTKIAIEATPEAIGRVNERYQAYLKGEYTL